MSEVRPRSNTDATAALGAFAANLRVMSAHARLVLNGNTEAPGMERWVAEELVALGEEMADALIRFVEASADHEAQIAGLNGDLALCIRMLRETYGRLDPDRWADINRDDLHVTLRFARMQVREAELSLGKAVGPVAVRAAERKREERLEEIADLLAAVDPEREVA